MAANGVSGPHGRDISVAESAAMALPPNQAQPALSFGDVVDALNPLQYVPVVGTIYRVVTGDEGSPALRTAASLAGGFVMGGPVGLLTSIASNLAEHLFHFERMAHDLLGLDEPARAAGAKHAYSKTMSAPAFGGPR